MTGLSETSRFESTEVYHGLGIPISMAYSRNFLGGAALCVGDSEGYISLYHCSRERTPGGLYGTEPATKKQEKKLSRRLHSGSVTDAKFQNVGLCSEKKERYVYSASTDSFLVKFDLEHERESCRLRAHREWVKRFAISAEPSAVIATVGNDGSLRIYDDRAFHLRGLSLGRGGRTTAVGSGEPTRGHGGAPDETYFERVGKVYLAPTLDLSRVHEPGGRRSSIGREKMISDKGISVSGVAFLSESNYIATSGSTEGHVKVWDIRKASSGGGSAESACLFKFAPPKDEETQRGIVWMEADELHNKLALQTRKGTIHVYCVSGVLSCSEDIGRMTIDTSRLFRGKEGEAELLDASQRPSISGDGEWLVAASNSGSRFCLFDISAGPGDPVPYYVHDCREEELAPVFQCFAWERSKAGMGRRAAGFPPKDGNNNFWEAKCVGREYRLNFSVGTKSRKLCFYSNKEFQLDVRTVMPNFSGVSAEGDVTSSRTNTTTTTTTGRSNEGEMKSRWVSGEAFSCGSSFDGDMDVLNQLSLSSSLSVPFPKPSRATASSCTSSSSGGVGGGSEQRDRETADEYQGPRGTQGEKKTGFLTIGGIGFSEKDSSQSLGDGGAFGRPAPTQESVEKTPFRRSIPFMGSSQDSVGYPAPQRGQNSYMTQSQESLLTPFSPQRTLLGAKETALVADCEETGNVSSSSSRDFNVRRVIHIPLSQSNEEVLASPSMDGTELAESVVVPLTEAGTPGSSDRYLGAALQDPDQDQDQCEESKRGGFKQRRLDSWVRVRRSTEGGSTANCSTAELSPIS